MGKTAFKMYMHLLFAISAILMYFYFVPRMFSADSDIAVLIAMGITALVPILGGLYIHHFFGKKKTSNPEESNNSQ